MTTVALVMQGHLKEALSRLRDESSDPADEPDRSVAVAVAVAAQVWALYEANELTSAEALFTQHRDVIAS